MCFESCNVVWHRPGSLRELLQIKKDNPDAKIVGGNTMLGNYVQQRV